MLGLEGASAMGLQFTHQGRDPGADLRLLGNALLQAKLSNPSPAALLLPQGATIL